MSIRKTMLWLLLVAVSISLSGLFGLGGNVMATKPLPHWGIDYNVTYESLPTKSGVATLRLTVERWKDDRKGCDSVTFMVSNKRGSAYSGPERWVVPLSVGVPYVCFVDLNIPDNDTCAVIIAAGCQSTIDEQRWFVTTGDTLEMYAEHPVNAPKYRPSGSDLLRAQFAPAQLQKEIDFRLDLRQAFRNQREFAEKSLGPLQSTDTPDVYLIRTTIENWCILRGDWGMRLRAVDEDAFDLEFLTVPEENPTDSSEASDSLKPQGSLDGEPSLWDPTGAISLERVTGLTADNTLPINQTITYYLRLNNNTGYSAEGMTNGFRVYSPDGATWSGTSGDTLGTLDWRDQFDLLFNIDYFSITGSGADTIGFGGSRFFNIGLPNGFNDTAYSISIGPIGSGHIGKTICLDSCLYLPSGVWKWTSTTGGDFFPSWDGPHCYQVDGLDIDMSFKYLSAGPTDTVPKPMRDVYVEMWDEDAGDDDLLASDTTDNTGFADFPAVSNYDAGGSGGQDIYFVVWAANEAARMTINPSYSTTNWTTDTTNDMSSGTYYWSQTASIEPSKAFYVADKVLDAYRKWNSLSPSDSVSDSLEVVLSPSATVHSRYEPDEIYLYINDSSFADLGAPDTWDPDIIWHEYGHHIEFDLGFFDVATSGYHEIQDTISEVLAAREGFCHWWACIVNGDHVWTDTWGNFGDSLWHDLENGLYWEKDTLKYGINAMGVKNEGAVAGILWDIYDGNNDDWSDVDGFFDKYDTTANPDGIWDSLSNGPNNILEALLDDGRMIDFHHPDDIIEFWDAWFDSPELGWDREMANIYFEHGDSTRPCCYGIRGNVDGGSEEEPDIADLIYLVDYMFTGGTAPPCFDEADMSGDGGIDITDLVWLVDYMFTGGPEPLSCYDKKHRTD